MSPPRQNLSAKQLLAARELARGSTIDSAAQIASCSEKTIDRWLQGDEFQQAIADIRRDIHSQAVGAIVDSLTTAVSALRAIAGDSTAPASSRVSAAKTLLDSAYRSIEGAELERRLIEVEMAVQEYRQS